MKSKAPLALMEQMIMVLVFALAAALCLRAFVLSDRMSRESEAQDRAVLLAQNAAEVCKAGGGDPQLLKTVLGGQVDGAGWSALYDEGLNAVETDAVYRVEVSPAEEPASCLGAAQVSVYMAESGELLFDLTAAWQEEVESGE